jgi:hypothetical protein
MTHIESSLKKHGVVCLKNTYLDEADLIRVAETFGDELVILPKELSFNNKDPRFP